MKIVVLFFLVFSFLGYGYAFNNPAYEYATPKTQRFTNNPTKQAIQRHRQVQSTTLDNGVMVVAPVAVEEVNPELRMIVLNQKTTMPTPVKRRTKPTFSSYSLVSGKAVYTTACANCHGKSAEKSALRSSKIIRGWNYVRISNALNEYKTQSYGGSMKNVMKEPSRKLTDAEILAVSQYISSL